MTRFGFSDQRKVAPGCPGWPPGSALRLASKAEDAFLLFLVGRRFREPVARRRLAAGTAEWIRTAFEFFVSLHQGHVQFPPLPNLLGSGGYLCRMRGNEIGLLGLDLGQFPVEGGVVPLQGSKALLERGKLTEQFRAIVRPPAVGQTGPLAGYGGPARHVFKILN